MTDQLTVREAIALLEKQNPDALLGWAEDGVIVPVIGVRDATAPGKRPWVLLRGRHVHTLRSVL